VESGSESKATRQGLGGIYKQKVPSFFFDKKLKNK